MGQQREGQTELLAHLRLPLLDQAPRRHHQAPLEIPAQEQLADEEPGHDRLTRARIVGEEVTQGLLGQHVLVDRGDLVRQRLDVRRVHRHHRVEQMR